MSFVHRLGLTNANTHITEAYAPLLTQLRDPDDLVHAVAVNEGYVTYPDDTVCEFLDDMHHWDPSVMRVTSDAPTCLRCIGGHR